MGRKKAKKVKENRLILSKKEDEKLSRAPHSFVFYRGNVGGNVMDLTMDVRRMMEPYTASNLQVQKQNVWKDFVAVGGLLGVTNILSFNKTQQNVTLRLARLPKGPTLYFKVKKYTLCKDIVSNLKRPQTCEEQYRNPGLLVLNNFQDKNKEGSKDINYVDPHRLCQSMLQNMFPSLNVHELNLNNVKRCVEFSVSEDKSCIEMRHYSIAVHPVGISRKMKKLVTKKEVPNLNKFDDVGEFLMNQGDGSASESEVEPEEKSKVQLPQKMTGNGNMKNHKSAVRLTELGPRMTLELLKIEDGLCEGKVLYHKLISKSEAELEQLEQAKLNKIKEKEYRKKVQEQNVKRKEEQKALNKEKSIQGMKRKHAQDGEEPNQANSKKPNYGKGSAPPSKSNSFSSDGKKRGFNKRGSDDKKPVKKAKSFFKKSKNMKR